MTDTVSNEASRRFRSPPYPAISLGKAVARMKELYAKALHHPVGVSVLADSWGYKAKSSGLWATAAALLQYGLLKDEGSGDKRRFTLTDPALRIARDPDPNSEKRVELIRKAAQTPKIFSELWRDYGSTGHNLSDMVLKSRLTVDRADNGLAPYSDAAADEVIKTYKETIAFAGLTDSATVPPVPEERESADNLADGDEPEGSNAVVEPPPPAIREAKGKVVLMAGERVVFTEESDPQNYLKLVASGEVDETMLEALEDYVKRQKKRLGVAQTKEAAN
jgi:hypothetical protein